MEVPFHSFAFVFSCICWLILSRMTLLIFPILNLKGLSSGKKSYLERPSCCPINLFIKAIQFVKQITKISDEDINLIMKARKTLLFIEDIPWVDQEQNDNLMS